MTGWRNSMRGPAQRITVRVYIDAEPEGVVLAAGMIGTVQIDPRR